MSEVPLRKIDEIQCSFEDSSEDRVPLRVPLRVV